MNATETKKEKGLNRYEADILNDFMLMVGKLDSENKMTERQLRKVLYHSGVYLYRHFHNLGPAKDSMKPSMYDAAKPHPMRNLVKK